MRRTSLTLLGVCWTLLMLEAFLLSPPGRPDTAVWVGRLLTGQWSGEEPLVVGLFNLMGVWPMVVAAWLWWPNLKRWTLGPFVLGSFVLGAFALIPGLVLTGLRGPLEPVPWTTPRKGVLAALALVGALTATLAIALGDVGRFAELWRTDQFVHVMSLDFCVFAVVLGVIAWEMRPPR